MPNKENNTVYLRELLESDNFKNHGSRLAFAVGKDIGGQVVVTDIAENAPPADCRRDGIW